MKKIALLHFQPLEKYPPVMNMINLLGEIDELKCVVITTANSNSWYTSSELNEILRTGKVSNKSVGRYWGYLKYNLMSLLKLIQLKPKAILGYETYSIWPIYVYQKWNKSVRVHLHYHEYVSPEELKMNSLYYKYLHRLEKKLLQNITSVSQTNSDRMELFLQDYPIVDIKKTTIWPNYPPLSWQGLSQVKTNRKSVEVVKFVHLGAVGMETMYIEEMVNWVIAQKGKYSLDFITDNIDEKAKSFLEAQTTEMISVRAGVNYFDLPEVLVNYDMGLTLYKGHIPNYVYNVPNKVMEYLVCGLPVAYSKELISTRKFIEKYQIVNCLELNFNDLNATQFQEKLKTTLALPEEIVMLMNNQKQDIKHFIQLMTQE
jgi:hypothetical protein